MLRHETINCWNAGRDKANVTIAFNSVQSAMKFMKWLNSEGNIYKLNEAKKE